MSVLFCSGGGAFAWLSFPTTQLLPKKIVATTHMQQCELEPKTETDPYFCPRVLVEEVIVM